MHGANFTLTNINGQSALALAVKENSSMAQTVIENHILSMLKGMVGKGGSTTAIAGNASSGGGGESD